MSSAETRTERIERLINRHLSLGLGEAIKRIRLIKGMSQNELETSAQLSRGYICYVERGFRSPKMYNIVRIADALEVSPLFILLKSFSEAELEMIPESEKKVILRNGYDHLIDTLEI